MSRYRFIKADNKVICISTFAKKPVKGIAKCSPNDTFDLEIGTKLAKLRCDLKVTDKRANRAAEKYLEATELLIDANEYFYDMKQYYFDSEYQYSEALKELKNFEKEVLK